MLGHTRWILATTLLACTAAPSGDDTTDTGGDDTDVAPVVDLTGAWKAQGDEAGPFDGFSTGHVGFLAFEPADDGHSGRVLLFGRDTASNVLACPTALYAFTGDGGLLVSSQDAFSGSLLVLLDVEDPDTIAVTDETGTVQTFERVGEVEAAATCGAVTIEADHVFELDPPGFANIVFDGTDVLHPVADGSVIPVDVDAGTTDAPLDYGSTYEHLVTMQGADGWGHCACGNSGEIVRTSAGGATVDEIDVDGLADIGVDSGAWSGTKLFVEGYSYAQAKHLLAVIDSEAEPDTLDAVHEIFVSVQHMTFHGGELLGVSGNAIAAIDPVTGMATQTWALPPELGGTWWRGIASDGTSVYVQGQPDAGGSRVVRLTLE